ncbi:SGS domain-containing protein [Xylariaceae sp. FL0804]|nr:SGS domain-containing protein [Xylariaceae sp. FL0804]
MPSAAVLAAEGVKAVAARDYTGAIAKFTEALKERPAPLWLLERSKAYLRTEDFDLALYDAEKALRVAFDRANRDYMIEAQTRRAITLFRMGRYADADICAFWAIRLCEGARASEDDGQLSKVRDDGDYAVSGAEVSEENKPAKGDGMAAAMGGGGSSKETGQKNQAFSWRLQALTQMDKLPAGHDGRKVHITAKYPIPSKEPPSKAARQEPATTDVGKAATAPTDVVDEATTRDAWEKLWEQYRTLHTKKSIRTSFYQTDSRLNVDIFVKNVDKDALTVNAQSQSVTLTPIPGACGETVELLLFDTIKPAETKHTVKSMKVELVLQKENAGKWGDLRRPGADIVDSIALGPNPGAAFNQFHELARSLGYNHPQELQLPEFKADNDRWYKALLEKLRPGISSGGSKKPLAPSTQSEKSNATAQVDAMDIDTGAEKTAPASQPSSSKQTGGGAPAYPTSSKKGPTNWDQIDDEDGEDKAEDSNVDSFFQSIYKNADPDTKRAMMKSYVESNGTSLSTSWAEAKSKTYETLPPDGSEAKKWDDK